jgi:hypothetical protein
MSKINKPIAPVFFMLALACITSMVLFSCNETKKNVVIIPVPEDSSDLGKTKHLITKTAIKEFRTAFNAQYDSLSTRNPGLFITKSEGFNKPALLELLKDPNCTGIRIYYGITKGAQKNELKLILVGIDTKGNDLYITGSTLAAGITQTQYGLEYGQCCQEKPVDE